MNSKTKMCLPRSIRNVVAVLGLLALGSTALRAQTLPPSPVGTWDVNITGSRVGLAYWTFVADGTFSAYELVVPVAPANGSVTVGRNGADDTSRDGFVNNTNAFVPSTNFFGSQVISGLWGFDSNGRIIGFFAEILQGLCSTNIVTLTNSDGTVTNVSTIVCDNATNEVSFIGSVIPGKRLTLNGRTASRRMYFTGLPALTLTNISGGWYGYRNEPGQSTTEFFTLVPSVDHSDIPNAYDVTGGSASYTYTGHALLSRWNRFALVVGLAPDGNTVRAVVGGFNKTTIHANTQGWEQPAGPLTRHITFPATRQTLLD